MKNEIVRFEFLLNKDLKSDFFKVAKKNDLTAAQCLRRLIKKHIKSQRVAQS